MTPGPQEADHRLLELLGLGLLAVFAGACTWIATVRGPGLTPDAVNYLRNATSITNGSGIKFFPASYGPGFPYLIASGQFLGLSGGTAVRIINSLASAATIILAFFMLARHVRTRWLVWAATVLVALSSALLGVNRMAWSEPVFIVLVLLLLTVLDQVSRRPRSMVWLSSVVVVLWLLFLFRFAGMCFIFAAPLSILLVVRRLGWLRAFISAVAVGLGALIVPVLWMVRNYTLTGTVLGPRPPPSAGPGEVTTRLLTTVGYWIAPSGAQQLLALLLGVGFWIAVVVCAVVILRTPGHGNVGVMVSAIPIVTVTAVYLFYISVSELTTGLDPIDDRLLVPVFVPLVVILASGVDRLLGFGRGGRTIGMAVVAVVGLLAIVSGLSLFQVVSVSARDGVGYAEVKWQKSPLTAAVAKLPSAATVYSDRPSAILAATSHDNTANVPTRKLYRSTQEGAPVSEFVQTVACNPDSYLAWYNANNEGNALTPGDLAQVLTLTVVGRYPDGTLYRLSAKSYSATNC